MAHCRDQAFKLSEPADHELQQLLVSYESKSSGLVHATPYVVSRSSFLGQL